MKCPNSWEFGVTYECLKEECAWWNNTNDECAILQLSKSIYFMGVHIAQIEIKMPHSGQFITKP